MDRLRAARLVLGAVLLGLAIHLVVGEKPWEGDAAALAWPRLEFDFWDDERATLYYFADGGYRQDRSGPVEEWRPRWRRTFPYETKRRAGPSNHVRLSRDFLNGAEA